jgi:hypothetical protein
VFTVVFLILSVLFSIRQVAGVAQAGDDIGVFVQAIV